MIWEKTLALQDAKLVISAFILSDIHEGQVKRLRQVELSAKRDYLSERDQDDIKRKYDSYNRWYKWYWF